MIQSHGDRSTAGRRRQADRRHRQRCFRLSFEKLEERCLLATVTVTGTGDTIAEDGKVTLREAIISANNNASINVDIVPVGAYGSDTINFKIPGTGVHTISPTSALPAITDSVIIDGYTQRESSPNKNGPGLGNNAVLRIELDGTSASPGADGLTASGGSSTLRGLIVNRFSGNGIRLASNSNVVEGNLIGTDASGTVDLGNAGSGVLILNDTNSNRVGGTTPAARNVISGNNKNGVQVDLGAISHQVLGNFIGTDITGTQDLGNTGRGVIINSAFRGSSGNVIGGTVAGAGNIISGNDGEGVLLAGGTMNVNFIQGNYIGTDVTGTVAIGNGTASNPAAGIHLQSVFNTTIGGTTALARNVISGNKGPGIVLAEGNVGGPTGTLVLGNFIGTQADGTSPLGNGSHGVANGRVFHGGIVGGTAPGTGNVIAFNSGDGVNNDGDPLAVVGNSIFANGGLGIKRIFSLAAPVLTSVLSSDRNTIILGTLNSTVNTSFRIEFFANDAADPSGFGEGQTFIGTTTVMTKAAGHVQFTVNLPLGLAIGRFITATATQSGQNTSEFSLAVPRLVTDLRLGETVSGTITGPQDRYFRVEVPAATDVLLTAQFNQLQGVDILVLYREVPSPANFDLIMSNQSDLSPEILLPSTVGTYFIQVHGRPENAGRMTTFALSATTVAFDAFEVRSVSVDHGSNAGQVTTTIAGVGFTPATIFSLMAKEGTERRAATIVQQSDRNFFATFDLVGLVPGVYDVRAVDGSRSAVADDAFTVTTGIPGQFWAQLVLPGRIRNGREGVLVVEYANLGETDIPAPLLIVKTFNANVAGREFNYVKGASLPPPRPIPPRPIAQFLAISADGPAGVLPPGARSRVEIRFQDDGSQSPNFHASLDFLLLVAGLTENFDLASSKEDLRPSTVDPEAWDIIFQSLLARIGTTVGQYVMALDEAANYLSRYGIYTSDIGRLVNLYVQQADSALPGQTLHAAVDAAAPASALPLVWGRSFAPTISRRFELGILGRGWSHPWDYRLVRERDSSDVLIRTPGGTRRFTEEPDGTFSGTFSDPGQLRLQGNLFVLRETSGAVSRFDAATGLFLEIEDRNGNRVKLNYTSGNLTSLVHSNGDQFKLGYNAQGRLSQLLDHAGRATTFEYDAADEHLLRVTGPAGTTAYTYDTTDGSPMEHALTSVTRPDATQIVYAYDAQGRQTRIARDGGAEAVTFSYGSIGEVLVSDASGATSSLFFNEVGQILETRDPLGRTTRLDYDSDHRLDRVTLPLDTIALFDFDGDGNLTSLVNQTAESTARIQLRCRR